MIKVALLEDDEQNLTLLEQLFVEMYQNGAVVECFVRSIDLLSRLQQEVFDLVVLDRELPDMPGDILLQWINRQSDLHTCVLMLTSNNKDGQVVKFLSMGADEYLTKPFSEKEFKLRAQRLIEFAQLKRKRQLNSDTSDAVDSINDEASNQITLHGFTFDEFALTVLNSEQLVILTDREFRLALFLFKNVGLNLSKSALLEGLLLPNSPESMRSLIAHIHRLRDKLDLKAENGWVIRPVYGYGYRLDKME